MQERVTQAFAPGFVYFVRFGAFVKIGYATNVRARFRALCTTLPEGCELLRFQPGTVRDERALHKRFAGQRNNGEWFRLEGGLRDYLKECGCDV